MKKAQMMMSPRKSISLVLGFLILIAGLIPVLNQFKIIGFTIPVNATLSLTLAILLIVGALVLFYDAYDTSMGMPGAEMYMFGLGGIIAIAAGIVPLLNALKVVSIALPAVMLIAMPWAYVIAGFFLIIGGFVGM